LVFSSGATPSSPDFAFGPGWTALLTMCPKTHNHDPSCPLSDSGRLRNGEQMVAIVSGMDHAPLGLDKRVR